MADNNDKQKLPPCPSCEGNDVDLSSGHYTGDSSGLFYAAVSCHTQECKADASVLGDTEAKAIKKILKVWRGEAESKPESNKLLADEDLLATLENSKQLALEMVNYMCTVRLSLEELKMWENVKRGLATSDAEVIERVKEFWRNKGNPTTNQEHIADAHNNPVKQIAKRQDEIDIVAETEKPLPASDADADADTKEAS